MRLRHPFEPVFDSRSRILILGSFPSVRSRKEGFYYGHPQNRFWRVLAAVYGETVPTDIPSKKRLLLEHQLALWDAAAQCDIEGSKDSSIANAVPTDLSVILTRAKIERVLCNGQTAGRLYRLLQLPQTGIPPVVLPSTSPLNASWSLEKLTEKWGKELTEVMSEKSEVKAGTPEQSKSGFT